MKSYQILILDCRVARDQEFSPCTNLLCPKHVINSQKSSWKPCRLHWFVRKYIKLNLIEKNKITNGEQLEIGRRSFLILRNKCYFILALSIPASRISTFRSSSSPQCSCPYPYFRSFNSPKLSSILRFNFEFRIRVLSQ